MIAPEGYERLGEVLELAIEQASKGKGNDRHSNGESFEKQQICSIPKEQGSTDFCTGQAIKKCFEVNQLSGTKAKVDELLGAINYIAAAIIVLQDWQEDYNKFLCVDKREEHDYEPGGVLMVNDLDFHLPTRR
jgi:hypothetical protein